MAKKRAGKTRRVARGKPQVSQKGRIIAFSSSIPLMGYELKKLNLNENDTLVLTFKIDIDTKRLAKFIEDQGPPNSGMSVPSWAKKMAVQVGTEGLVEAIKKGVDLVISTI